MAAVVFVGLVGGLEGEQMSDSTCYDCGLLYSGDAWADVVVPDGYWEMINPTHHEGGGLLCFNCMNRRFAALGLSNVPFQIASGPFSFSVRGRA